MLESVVPQISASFLGMENQALHFQSNGFGNGLNRSVPAVSDARRIDLKAQVVEHVEEVEEDEEEAPQFDLEATNIKSSPYSDPLNFLNLTELDKPHQLFALALTKLQSTRPDYATAPYMSSFNWSEVFEILRSLCSQSGIQWQRTDFYVVIFRSKLRAEADRARLGELDQMSHQEACASGGLLQYWFGSPDAERRNLATCIWRNREDAAAGGKGPWHRKARGAAREMYETISFHTHKLVVEDAAASWQLEEYHG